MALFEAAPHALCILRLSAIGDVCHAISVVQAIQRHWPSTQITWITGKVEAQLIHDLPGVEVIVYDKKTGLKGMRAVWTQLGSRHFDALLHMQAAIRASVLTLGISAKHKIGFAKNRTREGQRWFVSELCPNTDAIHVLDNFAEFAHYIGVPFEGPAWDIPVSQSDRNFAIDQLSSDERNLVICAAASDDDRNWTAEGYAEFADYAAIKGFSVTLCGSPTPREMALANSIAGLTEAKVNNLVGETTLKQLVTILARADVVLAPDTGPAHLAVTQGTPVIGLYAHSDPNRTGPYGNLRYVCSVYEKFAMDQYGQAGKFSWGRRNKGSDLMNDIPLALVQSKFDLVCEQIVDDSTTC